MSRAERYSPNRRGPNKTDQQRADEIILARRVLARWRFRQKPYLPDLCREEGIPFHRFQRLVHFSNELPADLDKPPLWHERESRRQDRTNWKDKS